MRLYAKPPEACPAPPPPPRCIAVHRTKRVRCILGAHGDEIRHHGPLEHARGGITTFTWSGADS